MRLDADAILTYDHRLGEAVRSAGLDVIAPQHDKRALIQTALRVGTRWGGDSRITSGCILAGRVMCRPRDGTGPREDWTSRSSSA